MASTQDSMFDPSSKIAKLILSTGNIMTTGPSLIGHRPIFEKSNTELVNSLRTAFSNAKATVESQNTVNGASQTSSSPAPAPATNQSWTSTIGSTLHIPCPIFSTAPLAEERASYDITLKLFFLPSAKSDAISRTAHAHEALRLVLTALNAPNVDLLIVSFPGISFDADDDDDDASGDENETTNHHHHHHGDNDTEQTIETHAPLTRTLTSETRLVDSVARTWHGIEALHSQGLVSTLGVAEFGSERLQRLLPLTSVRPAVDQINVRDCCVVPKPLILYARNEGILLLTHNDCTDILPTGTVREILHGAFLEHAQGKKDGESDLQWLQGDIVPQWVVKYTAVVRDRGVIENKGYFAMAEIEHQQQLQRT